MNIKRVQPKPKREEHCWIAGKEVTEAELLELVRRCGGLAVK
jgi:hypothetical protein